MGHRDEGAKFGVPGLDFVGKKLPVPAQGDCVYPCTRVDLQSHHLHAIPGGEQQASVE